jgi:hypothetical protein
VTASSSFSNSDQAARSSGGDGDGVLIGAVSVLVLGGGGTGLFFYLRSAKISENDSGMKTRRDGDMEFATTQSALRRDFQLSRMSA